MKTRLYLISCFIAASMIVLSFSGCGKKNPSAGANRESAKTPRPAWVKQAIPKPDAEGWITLFDGKNLYGCDPAKAVFESGKIFIQGEALWVDSTAIPFQMKAREADVRVRVKKVSGQNVNITVGRDVGWFNGGTSFGIGRVLDGRYQDLQAGRSPINYTDFVNMQFLVASGNLVLMAGGKTVVKAQDAENEETRIEMAAFKGISVFDRIEIRLSDVQSLLPREENPVASPPKTDATDRLKQVKSLYDQGLINKDDYDKKVKEIMDSL